MLDADDVGSVFLISIPIGIFFLIWYLCFSVPVIDACHDRGGVMVKIDTEPVCIDKESLKKK